MYRMGMISGALATVTGGVAGTASSAIFALQWQSPNVAATTAQTGFTSGWAGSLTPLVCMITQMEINLVMTTAPATMQDLTLGLFMVATFTAAGTGGTLATFTVSQNRFDSLYPNSNFATTTINTSGLGFMQMATTTNLGTLTGTVDIYPMRVFSGITGTVGAAVGNAYPLEFGNDTNTQALFLRHNQGFIIQPMTAWATVVASLYINLEWIEMPNKYT
jgi:hypothetical protein